MNFILILAIAFLLKHLLGGIHVYSLVKKNNDLQARFDSGNWEGLEKDLIKLEQTASVKARKKNELMVKLYNNTHMMLAAIAYLNGDNDQFLFWMQGLRNTDNYPHFFALLALYYRAEADAEQAYKCCDKFRSCTDGPEDTSSWSRIINCFFPLDGSNDIDPDTALEIAEQYTNPIVIELVKRNCDILWEDDEDSELTEVYIPEDSEA